MDGWMKTKPGRGGEEDEERRVEGARRCLLQVVQSASHTGNFPWPGQPAWLQQQDKMLGLSFHLLCLPALPRLTPLGNWDLQSPCWLQIWR